MACPPAPLKFTVLPAVLTVNEVMVGGVRSLMFNILVEAALLNVVIVPELIKFTMPFALLVMPVIAPEVFRLMVSVLVKFTVEVDEILAPVIDTVPALVSVLGVHRVLYGDPTFRLVNVV